jgi:hypothetical protein
MFLAVLDVEGILFDCIFCTSVRWWIDTSGRGEWNRVVVLRAVISALMTGEEMLKGMTVMLIVGSVIINSIARENVDPRLLGILMEDMVFCGRLDHYDNDHLHCH